MVVGIRFLPRGLHDAREAVEIRDWITVAPDNTVTDSYRSNGDGPRSDDIDGSVDRGGTCGRLVESQDRVHLY